MNILKFKIPLKIYFDDHSVNMSEIDCSSIHRIDIENLDGQYDWIDAWRNRDYDLKMGGFNSKDVSMEVVFEKGDYIVTLVSEKPFDTMVRNSQYYSSDPNDFEDVTLKEAVVRFLNGCISDGIGENEIGYVMYLGMECDVWLGNLEELTCL